MKKIEFILHTQLSVNATIAQIANLLTSEHISFKADQNSIRSIEIPLPFWSFDKRLYTRKNWVGVNPFIFISEISFSLKELSFNQTQIDVNICQKRAIILYVFFISLLFFVLITAALSSDLPWAILIFLAITMPIIGEIFIFNLCIRRLIKAEIVKTFT